MDEMISFVKLEEKYPIFLIIDVPSFMEDDFIKELEGNGILFRKDVIEKRSYYRLEISNEAQVGPMFECAYTFGSMNDFVGWSFDTPNFLDESWREKEYLFGIFKRRYSRPRLVLEDQSTVFWIAWDGIGIEVFSTHSKWNSVDQIQQMCDYLNTSRMSKLD
ncbi:hypothetical protein [Thermoactinomyces sp. DSM 45892]|uniref:hypothetical protein n=1 Tax=Thermoactinomyces sp. DSM 45892 TaxID=1882753 RepID=UPI0015A21165|nr:hypothetical protein [Thermoactinomyces sp. DSM 45892]